MPEGRVSDHAAETDICRFQPTKIICKVSARTSADAHIFARSKNRGESLQPYSNTGMTGMVNISKNRMYEERWIIALRHQQSRHIIRRKSPFHRNAQKRLVYEMSDEF